MHRRAFLAGIFALAITGPESDGDAKRRSRKARRRTRSGASTPLFGRGTTDGGECPCNGGKVCVGPRGGRYCITRSSNKRYGV